MLRSRIGGFSRVSLSQCRLLGLVLTVFALAGAGGPAPAARGATLRWKFKPGQSLHYTMDQKSVATAKLPGGQETKTTLSQTIEMTWSVKSVDDKGTAEMTQTITRIRDQVEGTVGSYTYDSKDGKEPESLIAAVKIPVFKVLLGAAVKFKLSARGEPGDVRIPESMTKMLTDLGPQALDFGALLSEEGLKEMIGRASLVFPEEDVAVGKTWTLRTRTAAPVGALVLDSTYRNEGPAPKAGPDAVKINVDVKAEILAPEAAGNPNPEPNPAAGLKVRSQKSQGTYTFDTAAGHILDSGLSEFIEVSSKIKIGVGPAAKELEIIQINESTTLRKLVKVE